MNQERTAVLRFALGGLEILAAVLAGFVLYGATPDRDLPSNPFGSLLGWAGDQQAWAVPFLALLVYASQAVRTRVTTASGKELAKEAMNVLAEEVFPGLPGGVSAHHQRATIFKHRRPWRGWWQEYLCIVERSTHTTRRSKTRFRAPKERPELAEGVAGMAWNSRDTVVVPADGTLLPDLNGHRDRQVPDADIVRYAQATNVEPEWVRKRVTKGRYLARSFVALRIENADDVWGVVVLESAQPEGIDVVRFHAVFPIVARLLRRAISRGFL